MSVKFDQVIFPAAVANDGVTTLPALDYSEYSSGVFYFGYTGKTGSLLASLSVYEVSPDGTRHEALLLSSSAAQANLRGELDLVAKDYIIEFKTTNPGTTVVISAVYEV